MAQRVQPSVRTSPLFQMVNYIAMATDCMSSKSSEDSANCLCHIMEEMRNIYEEMQHCTCSFSSLAVPSGPPQNLRVSSRTTTSITLTWSGPALDRINDKDGVTGFVVKKNGVQVAKVTELLSSPSITFTGLRPAESYAIEVLAVNDQGTAPPNHAARLTATTASGGMHISQLNTLLPHCLTASSLPSLPLPLPSLSVPSSPTLRVVLPRFSNTYLVWSDPEPFVGPITGFQIRYLIDGVPLTIPELSGGVHQYSVSGIKGSKGKTHSVSLRAKTAAGYGNHSKPVEFTFRPIGEKLAIHYVYIYILTTCMPCDSMACI